MLVSKPGFFLTNVVTSADSDPIARYIEGYVLVTASTQSIRVNEGGAKEVEGKLLGYARSCCGRTVTKKATKI